jgi:hypothetical protein
MKHHYGLDILDFKVECRPALTVEISTEDLRAYALYSHNWSLDATHRLRMLEKMVLSTILAFLSEMEKLNKITEIT